MTMSRDRVRFKLDFMNMNSATRRAFQMAFGTMPGSGFHGSGSVYRTIICRPSQFARFLIFREKNGGQNLFKNLEAELISADEAPQIIDVSTNPASKMEDCQ